MEELTPPRIVLVDPGFSSNRLGHHYKLNRGYGVLLGEARCVYAVNQSLRSAPGIAEQCLIRAFAQSHYEAVELRRLGRLGLLLQSLAYRDHPMVPRRLRALVQAYLKRRRASASPSDGVRPTASLVSLFITELETLIDSLGLGEDDHLVFPSLDTQMGRSLLDLVVARGTGRLPALHLRLMYDDATRSEGGLNYEGLVERLKATGEIGRRISLYCETDQHARALRKLFGVPIGVAPFPADGLPPPMVTSGRKLVVAYLGEARQEKGFAMLEPAIAAFARNHASMLDKIAWRIHAGGGTIEAAKLRDAIRTRPWQPEADLRFQLGSLAPEDYEKARSEADVVLALQDPQVYGNRGSGIIQEAVAGGRPFIYRRGVPIPSGAAAIEVETPDDVADAVARIATNPAPWFARARAAAARVQNQLASNDLVAAFEKQAVHAPDPPVALVVGPWMPDSGSAWLMAMQCRALTDLGFLVVRVHLARPGERASEVLAAALKGFHRDRDVALSLVVEAGHVGHGTWDQSAIPDIVETLFRQDRVRLIVGNFPQSAEWIDRLPTRNGCVRILETHDLRLDPATGTVLGEPAPPPPGFDAAIFVNPTERLAWAAAGQANCVTILPPLDDRADGKMPNVPEDWDILFVGSAHERNRRALARILDEILAHPDMADVSLLVVGGVAEPGAIPRANTVVMGHLDDLEGAYASARLVVTPHGGPGGIPSKVLGALCRGRPLVADAAAVSFLPDPTPFACEDTDAFRRRLRDLLDNPSLRRQAATASRQAWKQLDAGDRYLSLWRNLLVSLGAPVEHGHAGSQIQNSLVDV